ncbi:MAG TPA: dTDP-4-dehydrorhamnose 3,5-epimerase [Nocardioides sp.]|uniref:dTDP-4-dehydrorhamnose 3,5-epimerase family protein n=1 Tax=Nocardioides sp. TaxID=35761 RepID=UPI002D7F2526|nr:dTDP-4-dehydrorhamnose 3,5-epimerase [Nocardioides sp.]HET6653750.1 dTDP-4-dehydrorhamnose 3,5-epimerase [Nocardioides sp.]
MEIRELKVGDAYEVTPKILGDSRGAFLEWFRADRLQETTGRRLDLLQANASISRAGAVRGIHFADVPPGQAKYVSCPRGALLDVVVDIRVGSPTFGAWDTVLLDDVDRRGVFVSEGLGHGFMALEDDTMISYLCSAPYTPAREHGVHPLDPAIGIEWPTTGRNGAPLEPLLSTKDTEAPSLADAEQQELLPSYDAVQSFLASLRG